MTKKFKPNDTGLDINLRTLRIYLKASPHDDLQPTRQALLDMVADIDDRILTAAGEGGDF